MDEFKRSWNNLFFLFLGAAGVVGVFLFQDFNFIESWNLTATQLFITRKFLRVVLNDLFMLLIISTWFKDKQITRLTIFIQLIDGLILLPLYLMIKLNAEGASEISSPLLSQFHRIIINPTLMILLIPSVYFQRLKAGGGK